MIRQLSWLTDNQYPDQQLGIDRWPPRVTVEIRKMGTDAAQVDEPVNGSKQVVLRDVKGIRTGGSSRW